MLKAIRHLESDAAEDLRAVQRFRNQPHLGNAVGYSQVILSVLTISVNFSVVSHLPLWVNRLTLVMTVPVFFT